VSAGRLPLVGDEVEYAPGRAAVVTDIRKGVLYLRVPGSREWPVREPRTLTVIRSRVERIEAGELW
jgi:hypothetical protein